MILAVIRFFKRFAVLVPGIAIAYFSIKEIYPSLDTRLPVGLAVLLTYGLGAYVLIPAVIRLYRIFMPVLHPPTYSVTPDGFASDPINIAIVGTQLELVDAMAAAGWDKADAHTPINVIRTIASVLTSRSYPSAPMSSLYLNGRSQDLGFEVETNGASGQRHHVRFWATRYDPDRPLNDQHLARYPHRPDTSKPVLWLGAASKDNGFALIRHNVQITHMIHPDTDKERNKIVEDLGEAGKLEAVEQVRITEPYRLVNRAWRGYLESDGILAICRVKD